MIHLKRGKKLSLVPVHYPNLTFACKLSQMRYIVNLKYSNFDPISDEAWRELIVDLVGDDEMRSYQLISHLVEVKRDVKATRMFVDVFGHECLNEFFYNNIEFLDNRYIRGGGNKSRSNGGSNRSRVTFLFYLLEYFNPSHVLRPFRTD